MKVALAAARVAEGRSGPNPPVGCAIVSPENELLSVGHTAIGGRPHAETEALSKLEPGRTQGASVYVTLEPCAHIGKTGACASALIEAGVGRVVIAVQDPDSRVNGVGIGMLRAAGVDVETGVCNHSASRIMAGFLTRTMLQRPFLTWKTATSLDGMIALADGKKRWVTGSDSRRFVHVLRSRVDGVLSAIGTVLADDPLLTCRNPGLEADSPARFILDSRLRLPPESRLVQTAVQVPVTIFCGASAPADRKAALQEAGVTIIEIPFYAKGRLDLDAVLKAIAEAGCNHLLVEAGAGLAKSLFKMDLIDRIVWTQSPHLIGGDGIPAIGGLSLLALPAETHYIQRDSGVFDQDSWIILERRPR